MSHRSYEPVKPAASKMLQKKWDDDRFSAHRQKVRNAKPTIDNAPPKTHMHVQVKLKKLQLEEERLAKIERDNRLLLEKMSTILRTRGAVDNVNDYEHKSLNRSKRQQELVKITHENQAILKRIQAKGASYSRDTWARDHDASQTFKSNITRFPAGKAGSSTRRRSKGSMSKSDAEADSGATASAAGFEEEAHDTAAVAEPAPVKKKSSSTPVKKKSSSTPAKKQPSAAKLEPAAKAARQEKAGVSGFDANKGADLIHDGDTEQIVDILGSCNRQQRLQMIAAYRNRHDADLREDIKKKLSGDLEALCLGLLMSESDYEAFCIHDAVDGAGTDETCLVEILSSRSNDEIAAIAESYKANYSKDLAQSVEDETSGILAKILFHLASGRRPESTSVDRDAAEQAAKELVEGAKGWGTDEGAFFKVLTQNSSAQLRAVTEEFNKQSDKSLYDVIEKEFSGELEDAMLALVRTANSRADYFARRLQDATEGIGTDEKTINRIVISRCEQDMDEIKTAYQKLTDKSLKQTIDSETDGDYQKLLLQLIGESDAVSAWS